MLLQRDLEVGPQVSVSPSSLLSRREVTSGWDLRKDIRREGKGGTVWGRAVKAHASLWILSFVGIATRFKSLVLPRLGS